MYWPHLTYAIQSWSQHLGDSDKLEKVHWTDCDHFVIVHNGTLRTYRSGSDSDLPTPIAVNRSTLDSSLVNDVFHTPDPKLGMNCLYRASGFNGPQSVQTQAEYISVSRCVYYILVTVDLGVSDGQSIWIWICIARRCHYIQASKNKRNHLELLRNIYR